MAQSIVGAPTAAGAAVGAVPIPIADALILSPIEVAEINAFSKLYEIDKNEDSKQLLNSIVEVGTASLAAKAAISTLKAIPGINIATSALNAIIAGSIVTAIGEGSIHVFEKIYLGEKSAADIDWIRKVLESEFSSKFVDKVIQVVEAYAEGGNSKDGLKSITELLLSMFGSAKETGAGR